MTDFRILPTDAEGASRAIVLSVIGCTAGILALDALMGNHLASSYRTAFSHPSLAATALYMTKAATDELARLVLLGGVIALLRNAGYRITTTELGLLIVLAQVAILIPQMAAPADTVDLAYDLVRFVGPGVLWGVLLLRYGFVAALLGHTLTHPILDPLLGLVLAH